MIVSNAICPLPVALVVRRVVWTGGATLHGDRVFPHVAHVAIGEPAHSSAAWNLKRTCTVREWEEEVGRGGGGGGGGGGEVI